MLSDLDHRDDAIRAIRRELSTFTEGGPPVLRTVLPLVQQVLHADQSLAYGVSADEGQGELAFLFSTRIEESFRSVLDRMYRDHPSTTAHFNPARPDPAQRNRALLLDDLVRMTGNASPRAFTDAYPRLGLRGMDQARVLVCKGESLLGWVGGFRLEAFSTRDTEVLDSLTPALQQRLWLERQLDTSRFALAALDQALELLPISGFVLNATGRILHANQRGQGRLKLDPHGTRAALAESFATSGTSGPFTVSSLAPRGAPGYSLLVERNAERLPVDRVTEARTRFHLTPRQTEVLGLLLKGYANKSIAADLQCSVKTVEVHITALLSKMGAESRTELLAKIMTL